MGQCSHSMLLSLTEQAASEERIAMIDQAQLNRIARRVGYRWERSSIRFDFIDDLQQEALAYQLEHGDDQWFLIDVRRRLNDVCAAWCWQSKRADTKGLKVLENGVGDSAWLEQSSLRMNAGRPKAPNLHNSASLAGGHYLNGSKVFGGMATHEAADARAPGL
jgi:hypothetical protein